MKKASQEKILSFKEAPTVMEALRLQGKKIVQCHGTFDLLHPGHMVHFEEAAELGDVLVVTITEEVHVNKGPGRPYFNDPLRTRCIAALDCVDYVVLVPHPAAVEAIDCIRPDVYCKGKEYEDPEVDVTGNIFHDIEAVKRHGGRVAYVGSVVFSSTKLLNRHFETYSPRVREYCAGLAREFPPERIREVVEAFKDIKVLVVGDIIFDKYSSVSVQGLTSKNRILSGRFIDENIQAGGALAIFRHIREFTPQVKLLSLAGTEPWLDGLLAEHLKGDEDWVLREKDFTTIIKHRFVEPMHEGKELSKLFSVNYIDGDHPGAEMRNRLVKRLETHIRDFDLVMVADFGHGVMTDPVRELVQEKARFLALNCQTNSNNHGFNIINRQYRRADSFSLDRAELSLACGKRHFDAVHELQALKLAFGARYGWFTRGATETIGMRADEPACFCEPLEQNVIDSVGAGDAFSSLASLSAVAELPIELSTYFGQLAGAIAVRIVGNTECVTKSRFLKAAEAMLNF